MRRTALFALLLSVSACSSGPTEPEEIVPTETTADAVRVTSTPGVAVWTKLWRWETNTQPTIPGDVASNEGGTTFIVRGKAGQAYPAYLMQYLDVTRYAADGSMGFRTELDTVNIEPDSLHIAAGGTRVAVGANRRIDAAEHGLVYVLTSGGTAVTTVQIDASQAVVSDVAVDGNGNTFVAGHGYGAITIDGAPMGGAQGENNAFLMKLDPSGNRLFFHTYAGKEIKAIATDGSGNIYIGSQGALFAGTERRPTIHKLGPDGSSHAGTLLSMNTSMYIHDIAVTAGGRVAFMGSYYGSAEELGLPYNDGKYLKPFVGKLSIEWEVQFARAFDGAANRLPAGVAIDSYGQVIATFNFTHSMTVDGTTYTTADGDDWDNMLIKMSPLSGSTVWAKRYRGNGAVFNEVKARGIAVSKSSDRILMVGTFRRDVDFGRGWISGSLAGNGFLTRFNQ
jgi:hypothetical protein